MTELSDIIEALPGVVNDIHECDDDIQIALVLVITENSDTATADFSISTGADDALRMLRDLVEQLESKIEQLPVGGTVQ